MEELSLPQKQEEEKHTEDWFGKDLLDREDWKKIIKLAKGKHNTLAFKEIQKKYESDYPEEQEGIEVLFDAPSALSSQQYLEIFPLNKKERKKKIRELIEYQYLLTHFLISNSKKKEKLKEFWSLLEKIASVSKRDTELETMRQGILGQVATFLALDKLHLHPHLAHPRLDMFDQIDLQAQDLNTKGKEIDVQIKSSKRVTSPEVFSWKRSKEVYFPSAEIEQGENNIINLTDEYFAQKNKKFQIHLQKYRDRIKKEVEGYLVVIPYKEIDYVTGQPSPELIDFLGKKIENSSS